MPESRRRKPKRTGQQKMAAVDGAVLRIRACCRIELTIGMPVCKAAHEARCRVPTDPTDAGQARRFSVLLILRDRLEADHGIRATVLLDTSGASGLLVHSDIPAPATKGTQ